MLTRLHQQQPDRCIRTPEPNARFTAGTRVLYEACATVEDATVLEVWRVQEYAWRRTNNDPENPVMAYTLEEQTEYVLQTAFRTVRECFPVGTTTTPWDECLVQLRPWIADTDPRRWHREPRVTP